MKQMILCSMKIRGMKKRNREFFETHIYAHN
jgi:hypothetical protein